MTVTEFDQQQRLIIVDAKLWSVRGDPAVVRLALDTGASETLVTTDVVDRLGYGARQAERRTIIRSAIGDEPGYLVRIARFAALGFSIPRFPIHAHDLPDGFEIDGLLGLSFLRRFNYEVRSAEGRILAEPT